MPNSYPKQSILVFFAVVTLLSAAVDFCYCTGGSDLLMLALMWLPALAAVFACITVMMVNNERFSLKSLLDRLGFHRCRLRYILLAVLLPLIYLLIPYLIYWNLHPDDFAYSGVALWRILADCLPVGILGIFGGLLSSLGEEIGWRGFLLPALKERLGFNRAVLIVGLFWCLWHFPLLLFGGYMQGVPMWYQLPAFVLCIFPVSVIMAVLTEKSGSVWPAAFLHAAHNNFDQSIFQLVTRGEDMLWYVSETGVFTILCAWVIAAVLYISFRREEKRQ